MKDHYINATIELLRSGDDPATILSGLKKTLATRGHQALYTSILNGVARLLQTKNTQLDTVVVARAQDVAKLKADIGAAAKELQATSTPEVVVDDTLIGGFILQSGTTRIDQSYKSKLISLYRSLIT